jgi:hypothetical protein
MELQKIIDSLGLTALTNVEDRPVSGVYISDMLSDVMANAQPDSLWLTVQTHKNIVSAANLVDIAAVVVVQDKKVPQDTIDLANRFHVIILSTPLPSFALAGRLVEFGLKP